MDATSTLPRSAYRMKDSLLFKGIKFSTFFDDQPLNQSTNAEKSAFVVSQAFTNPFANYQSRYYSPFYIKSWARGVVPEPMLKYIGFRCFEKIITRGRELIYVYNSHDVFTYCNSRLASYSYSYVNAEWRSWCRIQYGKHHNYLPQPDQSVCAIETERLTHKSNHSRKTAFVISWHQDHGNYWHFTYDVCYRLLLLVQHLDKGQLFNLEYIVVGPPLKRFQEDLIQAVLGFKPTIIYYKGSVCVESAIHIPPTNAGFIDPHSCRELRFRIHSSLSDRLIGLKDESQFSNIYITRGAALNGRCILNEASLLEMLKEYRFGVVDPGQLPLYEQVRLFSNASIIIGPHGSAFVNAMHCHRGMVVELVDTSYDPIHDFIIANANKVRFVRIKSGHRISKFPGYSHTDFNCDLAKVRRLLTLIAN